MQKEKRKDEAKVRQTTEVDKNGYLRFSASKQLVHRFLFYIANPYHPRDGVVHHIDGNKRNNDLSNLIWMRSDDHSMLHGCFTMRNLPNGKRLHAWIESREEERTKERIKKNFSPKIIVRKKKAEGIASAETETRILG